MHWIDWLIVLCPLLLVAWIYIVWLIIFVRAKLKYGIILSVDIVRILSFCKLLVIKNLFYERPR